ncbi:ABC transporter substrate-binding protein [Amycolatopsis sp. MtRt-6]|uniref:ABC transporter substrate-binding protein n=1 Tax=Amycolatopsis sp. MtRt-6 TaxID=2792782 RepID=UPI001F5D745D|nr:ABC transporter substrate-binding protein [Amycolatopsis sp. MtRt-6]
MRRTSTRLAIAVAAATAMAGFTPMLPTAAAIDRTKGRPGFCPDDTGVTVVVDFQQLGGTTIVRCDPRTAPGTGLDALKGAGFQIAGLQRWGEAFVCRIENRPSATEELPLQGRAGYRESCLDTPPPAGYWSYWHAGNNCQWEYSQWGAKNREFVPGGFEGWSFSLNAPAGANPKPRVAAVRPGTSGRPCQSPDEPPPAANDPNVRQEPGAAGAQPGPVAEPGRSGSVPTTGPAPAGGTALPPPKPRPGAKPTADDPAGNAAFTGAENAQDVAETAREESGAGAYAPWAAGGVLILLSSAIWLTARRRNRAGKT